MFKFFCKKCSDYINLESLFASFKKRKLRLAKSDWLVFCGKVKTQTHLLGLQYAIQQPRQSLHSCAVRIVSRNWRAPKFWRVMVLSGLQFELYMRTCSMDLTSAWTERLPMYCKYYLMLLWPSSASKSCNFNVENRKMPWTCAIA